MRIILAGTGSAVGKTTIATGIMKALSEKYNVQPFKAGPDYIDPSYHTLATGNTSRNLDSFFMKEGQIRDSYLKGMKGKDIAVIEGVRGLYEGIDSINDIGSTASIAKALKAPVILIINKIDTVKREEVLTFIDAYRKIHDFDEIVPVSALKGQNKDTLLEVIYKYMPYGPMFYDEDTITDQPERQIVAELVREKALRLLDKEIPHGIAVVIERMKIRENGEILDIDATIYCEKANHKGIIIGKQGAMLKKISTMARNDCERFMGTKVYLRCWVKVKENWRDSDFLVRNFGYTE